MPVHKSSTIEITPILLSYTAALRGLQPRQPTEFFTYCALGDVQPSELICLAACNPEGQICGFIENMAEQVRAQHMAAQRNVKNIIFLHGGVNEAMNYTNLPVLDYLVYVGDKKQLDEKTRATLFALAQKHTKPNGLLCLQYKAYEKPQDNLAFLVNELSPHMNDEQKLEFLNELLALSPAYFTANPSQKSALEKAKTSNQPDEFFKTVLAEGKAHSGSFEVMAGLLPREFSFVGDANPPANFMALSTANSAQPIIEACTEHLLYEQIKDFAAQNTVRSDVWVRKPAEMLPDAAQRFGYFTFGTNRNINEIEKRVQIGDQILDLGQQPYTDILHYMNQMPLGIGDFLGSPQGKALPPTEVAAAFHLLVAVGIAQPMRGRYFQLKKPDIDKPKWGNAFNTYLNSFTFNSTNIAVASEITGAPIKLSLLEAMILQALVLAGMEKTVAMVKPEIERLANDPILSKELPHIPADNPEALPLLIANTINAEAVRWFGYGILAN